MHSTQQRFWPDAQPLVERLGRDFFRRLPEAPGVYLMHDKADLVLYVGKAKSLRHRLGSYRVANPERMPRRTLRLLHRVVTIRWEECADELAALRRESELLLALKPRFNRAGVWRGPRRYLFWRVNPSEIEIAEADQLDEGSNRLGRFGARGRFLRGALTRLLWCQLQSARGLVGMPTNWFRGELDSSAVIPYTGAGMREEIAFYLAALGSGHFDLFANWLSPPANLFEIRCREEDLAYLKEEFGKPREDDSNPAE